MILTNEAILYGIVLPFGLFGLETIIGIIWLYKTTDLKRNKLDKKGKTNGR